MRINRLLLIAVMLVSAVVPGCSKKPERRYELEGTVVAVDKAQNQVTIAHEEIPGFMDAMTMPFRIGEQDEWALSALEPGQHIEATLVVQEDRSWIEGLRMSKQEKSKVAAAGASVPTEGTEVPDFTLVNQDNEGIHLHQYRERPLLLTFIYTRCPLPDYCPRTSANFSEIYRALKSKPKSYGVPRLLTVSIDPEHDTPEVLREYAARYMNPVDFGNWVFATGTPEEVAKIAGYFGLSYRRESGQIVHSMMVALLTPDGRVARLFPGNGWSIKDVMKEVEKR